MMNIFKVLNKNELIHLKFVQRKILLVQTYENNMNILKSIIAIFVLCSAFNIHAQDGIFWGHTITFDLKNISLTPENKNDSLIATTFFVNRQSMDNSCRGLQMKGQHDAEYILAYSCSAIGGESMVKKIKCPDIYLKLDFKAVLNKNNPKYVTKIVPFVFETADGPFQKISIQKIDIYQLLLKKSPVVLIDAFGNYKVAEQESLDYRLIIYNLEKFEEK